MPKFIPSWGGYSGPKPVLHILSGMLLLSCAAWAAIQLAIVGFSPQFGTNNLNAQSASINNTVYDYQWRLLGVAGSLSAAYYAARWPMSRSATFMAFVACLTIALSFIPIDLANNYQVLKNGTGICSTEGIDSKWCGLQMGAQILNDIQTGLITCLAFWALARHMVADTYPHLVAAEHMSHLFVWLGLAAYACWCGAAVQLQIDANVNTDTAELLNQWNQPALNIAAIVGLTMAAFVSWGSTRGARVNALLFVVIGTLILAPAVAWDARTLWTQSLGGLSNCAVSFGNSYCMAKNALVAGIGGVAGVFLVLSMVYVGLLAAPVPADQYAYNAPAPAVKTDNEVYNPEIAQPTPNAAYPTTNDAVYEAPVYGTTPTNRYSQSFNGNTANASASPYPPV